MAVVAPQVREAMTEHPDFEEIGKRMLLAWQEGIAGLRDKRVYAIENTDLGEAFTDFSDPQPVKAKRIVVGRSDLLGRTK
jgi:serine/threonine-protein kinase HipA